LCAIFKGIGLLVKLYFTIVIWLSEEEIRESYHPFKKRYMRVRKCLTGNSLLTKNR
jgi:hypothetical protein